MTKKKHEYKFFFLNKYFYMSNIIIIFLVRTNFQLTYILYERRGMEISSNHIYIYIYIYLLFNCMPILANNPMRGHDS